MRAAEPPESAAEPPESAAVAPERAVEPLEIAAVAPQDTDPMGSNCLKNMSGHSTK